MWRGCSLFFAFVAAAVCVIVGVVNKHDAEYDGSLSTPCFKWAKILAVCGFAFCAITALVPSRKTMYMILGSEVSEAIATTDEGKEILGSIQAIVKGQLRSYLKDLDKVVKDTNE